MAEKTENAGTQGKAAAEPDEEPTFTVEDLITQGRRLFGVSPHIVAGALSKGGRKNYTEAEARKRVEEFSKKEIGG